MTDSQFDSSTFLDATTTEANERRPPIPAGKVLLGIIGEPNIRQTEGKKEKPSARHSPGLTCRSSLTSIKIPRSDQLSGRTK